MAQLSKQLLAGIDYAAARAFTAGSSALEARLVGILAEGLSYRYDPPLEDMHANVFYDYQEALTHVVVFVEPGWDGDGEYADV